MESSFSPQSLQSSFTVKTEIVDGAIRQRVTDLLGNVSERVIAVQDSQIKEALVLLGWAPPGCEVLDVEDETKNRWKGVIIDALVCMFLLNEENGSDPRKALNSIINMEVEMALDPRISERARQLLEMDPRDYKWD